MRVLHFGISGAFIYRIVKDLRLKGINADYMYDTIYKTYFPLKYNFVDDFCIPFSARNGYERMMKFSIFISKNYYDIIHVYNCLSHAGCGLIAKILKRSRYVVHDVGMFGKVSKKYIPIIGIFFKNADKVYFSMPNLVELAKKYYNMETEYVPCPIDIELFRLRADDKVHSIQEKFGNFIFCPSRLSEIDKKLSILLEAFRILHKKYRNLDINLVLVNYGESLSFYRPYLKSPNIFLVDPIPHSEMPWYYSAAEIAIDQFRFGVLGNVGFEAMACEKPLIAYFKYWSYYPEPMPIISSNNPYIIAEKIKELHEDDSLRKDIGKKAREFIVKYHRKEKFIKRIVDIYEEILRC